MRKRSSLVVLGLSVILIGVLVEIIMRYRYWSRPGISTGPILVATAGLTYLVPLGIVLLAYGIRQNET